MNSLAQKGLTLIEMMVAIAIMAIIFVLTNQSLDSAIRAVDVTQSANKRLEQIDRFWFLLKQDLEYVVPYDLKTDQGQPLPPFVIDFGQELWLVLLRSGYPNPLGLPRTDMVRSAYKYNEDTISRLLWLNPASNDVEFAREIKLLDQVESIDIQALPPEATTMTEAWQQTYFCSGCVPLAVEVTLTLTDQGELKRTFMLSGG